MAVNVTQKDKTLNDVIEWCEKHVARIDEKIPNASDEGFLTGERFALQAVIAHCEEQLGYSGSIKLKNWTFDVLGFVFFVLLEMFLYLIEVIDFFAKKKEQQCKTDM